MQTGSEVTFVFLSLYYLCFYDFLFSFPGDYDGALSVFTEMQLICQEKGLQLPGSITPVGEHLIIILAEFCKDGVLLQP